MGFEIRPVKPEEYAEAGRVTADAYREYVRPTGSADWDEYLRELADVAGRADRTLVLVAAEDGQILGTATLELDRRVDEGQDHRAAERLPAHEAHVRMVAVDPAVRRRGIGRALMEECIRVARQKGKTLLTLYTTERMKAAHTMYESMGFRRGDDWQVTEDFALWSYELPLG
jgi:GNAT superfamily N-acetyltransferase